MAHITITGTILDPSGDPPSEGTITFALDDYMLDSDCNIIADKPETAPVDATGNFSIVLESTLDSSPSTRVYAVRFVGVIEAVEVDVALGNIQIAPTPTTQDLCDLLKEPFIDNGIPVGVLANNVPLQWMNAAGTAPVDVIKLNASDQIQLAALPVIGPASLQVGNVLLHSGGLTSAASVTFLTTGSAALVNFGTNGITRWVIYYDGTLFPNADQTYDIGYPTLRARTIYSRDLNLGASGTGTLLVSDAADTLAMRNGANPQVFHIYRSYTDGSNWERLSFSTEGSSAYIISQAVGSGIVRPMFVGTHGPAPLYFQTNATTRWTVYSDGTLYPEAHNTYDIGYPSLRVRVGYFGTVNGTNLVIPGMPTSASGLPSGTLWNNGGVVNIVP